MARLVRIMNEICMMSEVGDAFVERWLTEEGLVDLQSTWRLGNVHECDVNSCWQLMTILSRSLCQVLYPANPYGPMKYQPHTNCSTG